ncbi:hypothetical protein ROG8370_01857 [Roseovarius gaetbuli]|uniref:Uncharacterized protein n=1 Tax=Roseovarius gaetbuli TaxID=1356575 RepID=A0A1X6Z7S8_9RHOB|nr:hypothetical protein ROG8370_01857 [Roseovarius gaetbuli]
MFWLGVKRDRPKGILRLNCPMTNHAEAVHTSQKLNFLAINADYGRFSPV